MLHGLKFLQIQQLALEQPEEILNHCVVQTIALAAHALPDALLPKHPLILLVLVVKIISGAITLISGLFNVILGVIVVLAVVALVVWMFRYAAKHK